MNHQIVNVQHENSSLTPSKRDYYSQRVSKPRISHVPTRLYKTCSKRRKFIQTPSSVKSNKKRSVTNSNIDVLHKIKVHSRQVITKRIWTKEEDSLLVELVRERGARNWSEISRNFPERMGKQCRERWHNHLSPLVSKSKWTLEEDELLISAHNTFGNKWATIAYFLPGRTDNCIKNHWNSTIQRRFKIDSKKSLKPTLYPKISLAHLSPPNFSVLKNLANISSIKTASSLVDCSAYTGKNVNKRLHFQNNKLKKQLCSISKFNLSLESLSESSSVTNTLTSELPVFGDQRLFKNKNSPLSINFPIFNRELIDSDSIITSFEGVLDILNSTLSIESDNSPQANWNKTLDLFQLSIE